MCSTGDNAALPALGFPIRASTGQWLFSASPWLIAAVHALLRLLVPRHPPCALTILTVIWPNVASSPVALLAEHSQAGSVTEGPVIPDEPASRGELVSAAAYRWRLMWLLCSFQGPWRGFYAGRSRASRSRPVTRPRGNRRAPVSQNSTACWGCCGRRSSRPK